MDENLTPAQITEINFELSKLVCPVHKLNAVVDMSINQINYIKCCNELELICENKFTELISDIQVKRIIDDLGLDAFGS